MKVNGRGIPAAQPGTKPQPMSCMGRNTYGIRALQPLGPRWLWCNTKLTGSGSSPPRNDGDAESQQVIEPPDEGPARKLEVAEVHNEVKNTESIALVEREAVEENGRIANTKPVEPPELDAEETADDDDDEKEIYSMDEIPEDLGSILDQLKSTCSFAHHEILKDAPNPELVIKGFGNIGFPLSERDINIIIAASGQSPLQDLVDPPNPGLPSMRRVWEVPGHLLETKNPSWKKLHGSILGKANVALGIVATVKGVKSGGSSLILYQAGYTPSQRLC